MIKYGVIGTGHMGAYHVNVLSKMMNQIEFSGIYDANSKQAKKISAKYDVAIFSSVEELIEKCNAICIATPTILHYSIAKKVLSAGKNVLIEKPICETIEQAEEIVQLAKDNKCVLHVGHVERHNGAVQELQKIIHAPRLWESRRLGPNIGRIKDVGVILDLMIHDIDICLRTVKSKVVKINALATYLPGSQYEDAATVQLFLKMAVFLS